MDIGYWKKFKKHLILFSSILGILIPIACFFILPLDIFVEPLSKFGVSEETKYLWLSFTQIIAILLYINNVNAISEIYNSISAFQYKILKYTNSLLLV